MTSFSAALEALETVERAVPSPQGWERLRPLLDTPRTEQVGTARLPAWGRLSAGAAALAGLVALASVLRGPGTAVQPVSAPPPQRIAVRPAAPAYAPSPSPKEAAAATAAPATVAAGHSAEEPGVKRLKAPVRTANVRFTPQSRQVAAGTDDSGRSYDTTDLEPDPELAYSPPPAAESVTEEVAQMVSTGLAPLVAAAEDGDPLSWITDLDAEEWL